MCVEYPLEKLSPELNSFIIGLVPLLKYSLYFSGIKLILTLIFVFRNIVQQFYSPIVAKVAASFDAS
jgi:hypothetical protein